LEDWHLSRVAKRGVSCATHSEEPPCMGPDKEACLRRGTYFCWCICPWGQTGDPPPPPLSPAVALIPHLPRPASFYQRHKYLLERF